MNKLIRMRTPPTNNSRSIQVKRRWKCSAQTLLSQKLMKSVRRKHHHHYNQWVRLAATIQSTHLRPNNSLSIPTQATEAKVRSSRGNQSQQPTETTLSNGIKLSTQLRSNWVISTSMPPSRTSKVLSLNPLYNTLCLIPTQIRSGLARVGSQLTERQLLKGSSWTWLVLKCPKW